MNIITEIWYAEQNMWNTAIYHLNYHSFVHAFLEFKHRSVFQRANISHDLQKWTKTEGGAEKIRKESKDALERDKKHSSSVQIEA